MREPEPDLSFVSADGSLHFERHIEPAPNARSGALDGRRLIVTDVASKAVLLDTKDWPAVETIARDDGAVDLRLSLAREGTEALFRIDPAARSFRDIGMTGPVRPLGELQAATDQARADLEKLIELDDYETTTRRYISRDGRLRIDGYSYQPERAPGGWEGAYIYDTATGEKAVDLYDGDLHTWLLPCRGESSGLGSLRVAGDGGCAHFILEPETMSFRAEGADGPSRPFAELPAAARAGIRADARRQRWRSRRDNLIVLSPFLLFMAAIAGIGGYFLYKLTVGKPKAEYIERIGPKPLPLVRPRS